MKIVFYERYYDSSYAMDPAASPGRLEGIVDLLSKNEEFELKKKKSPNILQKVNNLYIFLIYSYLIPPYLIQPRPP